MKETMQYTGGYQPSEPAKTPPPPSGTDSSVNRTPSLIREIPVPAIQEPDKPGKSSDIRWSIHEYIAPSLDRIARVSFEGNRKYGEGNWNDVSKTEMITHAIRHLCFELSRMEGCWIPEVGDDHLAHAACRVMMAIALEERGKVE